MVKLDQPDRMKNRKYGVLYSLIALVIVFGIGYLMHTSRKEQISDFREEYPVLKKDDFINGVVTQVVPTPSTMRAMDDAIVIIDNEITKVISVRNEIKTNRYFLTNVKEGVKLYKKKGSDTLHMTILEYGDTVTYSFILRNYQSE